MNNYFILRALIAPHLLTIVRNSFPDFLQEVLIRLRRDFVHFIHNFAGFNGGCFHNLAGFIRHFHNTIGFIRHFRNLVGFIRHFLNIVGFIRHFHNIVGFISHFVRIFSIFSNFAHFKDNLDRFIIDFVNFQHFVRNFPCETKIPLHFLNGHLRYFRDFRGLFYIHRLTFIHHHLLFSNPGHHIKIHWLPSFIGQSPDFVLVFFGILRFARDFLHSPSNFLEFLAIPSN